MINFNNFKSIISVINYFNEEDICKKALVDARWGDDVVCPFCGQHHCSTRKDGKFRCNKCKRNFSCLKGTIFENTKLPLQKWFIAMYLISSHKKGVSSCQIMRDCEVMQKTAWFMLQKIRSLYGITDDVALDGEVEMDEMYLGGREANKHQDKHVDGTQGRSTKTKTPIFGMQQRNGNVVAMKVEDTKGATLMPIVEQFVESGATTYTDEATIYNKLTENGYIHQFVNHSQREYVRASDIHTNSIEGFWAHFKRVIFSTYHMVSKDYLQRYIDEQVYRWNTRKESASFRFADMFKRAAKSFDYTDVLSLSSVVSIEHFREYRVMYYNLWKSTHCA
jgi:transposase-like protein